MSKSKNLDKFMKLADLAFCWFVMDSKGVTHSFKSEKEANDFIEKNDVMQFTSEGKKIKKGRGCKNAISSKRNNDSGK